MSHWIFDCNQGISLIYLRISKTGNGGRRLARKGKSREQKGENKNAHGEFLDGTSTNFHPVKQNAQLNKIYFTPGFESCRFVGPWVLKRMVF